MRIAVYVQTIRKTVNYMMWHCLVSRGLQKCEIVQDCIHIEAKGGRGMSCDLRTLCNVYSAFQAGAQV